ncbi:nitrate- and nitrite sensing domain-containing protein [bacterium]|nr:nitrate- and nitrite sensing domain-containing protein [bacterium]MBU1993873.1 nitrate- and nitrite sensing domain-containing protein [bacterium]
MRVILMLSILVMSIYAKSLFSNTSQVDNGIYIGALKNLVEATQKTRGTTNAYINGNESALLLIYNYRSDMKKAIGTMESLSLSEDPVVNTRATAISRSLITLNSKALKLSSEEAFDAYTENIAQILMLAQTISKKNFGDLNPFGKEAATVMMETILPLTENIGQLRGLGSGAAARGTLNKKQLYQLKALLAEVEHLQSVFYANMRTINAKYKNKYKDDLERSLMLSEKSIEEFSKVTKEGILKDAPNMDSSEYFDKGTSAITDIISIFDMNNKAIMEDSKGWI